MHGVEKLDRFGIEAIYAFEMAGHSTANAATLMHISPSAMYNDLATVKAKTGLNPYKPEQFKELYEALEETRKEKMHGAEIDIGRFICGE